jgi:hypothetical protein
VRAKHLREANALLREEVRLLREEVLALREQARGRQDSMVGDRMFSASLATRCPYVCTVRLRAGVTTREDGWRCGEGSGHPGGHVLYDAEGEQVLYTGPSWSLREYLDLWDPRYLPDAHQADLVATPRQTPEQRVGLPRNPRPEPSIVRVEIQGSPREEHP